MAPEENDEQAQPANVQTPAQTPAALVGSGAKKIRVRANVNTYGVLVGEETTVDDSQSVQLDAKAGYVTILDD